VLQVFLLDNLYQTKIPIACNMHNIRLGLISNLIIMGITRGMSFYHSIKGIQMKELLSISRGLSGSVNPTIYIDCNWVANYLGRQNGDYVQKTVDVLSILSVLGFIVYPVIDGDTRHHSKQVSVGERSLRKELAIISAKKNRVKALALTDHLNGKGDTLCEKDQQDLKLQRTKLEKNLFSAERIISRPFPPYFFKLLVDEIATTNLLLVNDIGGKVIYPVKARFQADTYIVKALITGHTSICVANDTDFAFLGGSNILQLSCFKLRGRSREQKKLIDLSLITPHSSTVDNISKYYDKSEMITTVNAKCKMLEIIPDNHHMIRALCAVCLGNDTNPGGISGVGPVMLMKQILEIYKMTKI